MQMYVKYASIFYFTSRMFLILAFDGSGWQVCIYSRNGNDDCFLEIVF